MHHECRLLHRRGLPERNVPGRWSTLRPARLDLQPHLPMLHRHLHVRALPAGLMERAAPRGSVEPYGRPVALQSCRSKRAGFKNGRGGAGRDRTGDLLNAIQALSQLSYSPTERQPYNIHALTASTANGDWRPLSDTVMECDQWTMDPTEQRLEIPRLGTPSAAVHDFGPGRRVPGRALGVSIGAAHEVPPGGSRGR